MPFNPALPLLALLALSGLLFGRKGRWPDLALPVAGLGLAGIALLAPALRLPAGIPSPAATLAALAPWQETGDPAAGNPLLRDVTYQIQPWLIFLREELRAGRWPFWNPHQFSGSAFWANGQSAPLFPLHLLFAALPLQLGFVLLPWLRLVIGGCGAWKLARELGIAPAGAWLSALIFPLSGMLVSFLLFPMGNTLALVPWVLWTVERIAQGKGRWPELALPAGLQLLGGHPETAAHTGMLSLVYLLVRGSSAAGWLRFAAGWLGALALAGVQIVPLLCHLPATTKWAMAAGEHPPLLLALQQPLRLVLPQLYGHPALGTWWGPFNYSATAVYAGALALPLAAAGLARCRGDRRWLAVAAVLAFSLAAAYHLPLVREGLAALPVLGKAASHRLLFGVELTLALFAGAGCDRWLAGKGRGLIAGALVSSGMLAAAWALYAGDWQARGLTGEQLAWTAGILLASGLLVLSLRVSRELRERLWVLLPVWAAADLLLAHGRINPGLALEKLYPRTGAVTFLQHQEGRVAGLGEVLRPNAAMVYGLYDLRGDDPVKSKAYEELYATLAPGDALYSQPIRDWQSPRAGEILNRLGVRWILAAPAEPPPVDSWRLAYLGTDARVYERPGARPFLYWENPGGGIERVSAAPGRWDLRWQTGRPDRLVIAEVWDAGWRARTERGALPVVSAGGLLGVDLPAGAGRLTVSYRPVGIAWGAAASLAALLGIAFGLARRRPV